jgi:DNA polymerase epsilon subunit 1
MLIIYRDMMVYLERRFEKKLAAIELVDKVDLELVNHLSGKLNTYIKLSFRTTLVKRILLPDF